MALPLVSLPSQRICMHDRSLEGNCYASLRHTPDYISANGVGIGENPCSLMRGYTYLDASGKLTGSQNLFDFQVVQKPHLQFSLRSKIPLARYRDEVKLSCQLDRKH